MSHPFKSQTNNSNSSDFDPFPCVSDQVDTAWTVLLLSCFSVGFPASIAIFWDMLKSRRKGAPLTPNEYFLLNLSIMDAVFLVFIPPGVLNKYVWVNRRVRAIWNSVYALNTCGRPLFMACICLDCYLAVVHPIFYHRNRNLAPRVALAGVVWTLSLVNGVAYIMISIPYLSVLPTLIFLIVSTIIVVCDCFIVHTLLKSDPGRRNIHPQKQRALQNLISSLIITFISYLPPVLLFTIGRPLTGDNFTIFMCSFAFPIQITSTLGSAVMPVLTLYSRVLDCSKCIWSNS